MSGEVILRKDPRLKSGEPRTETYSKPRQWISTAKDAKPAKKSPYSKERPETKGSSARSILTPRRPRQLRADETLRALR